MSKSPLNTGWLDLNRRSEPLKISINIYKHWKHLNIYICCFRPNLWTFNCIATWWCLKCQHGRHCDLESNKYFDSWQNALSHLTMGAGILTLASLGRLFWFRGAERTAELRPTGRWKLPCSGYYWHRAISWKLFGWQASFESIFTIPLSSFFIYTLV